jgi:hypothetical protein
MPCLKRVLNQEFRGRVGALQFYPPLPQIFVGLISFKRKIEFVLPKMTNLERNMYLAFH